MRVAGGERRGVARRVGGVASGVAKVRLARGAADLTAHRGDFGGRDGAGGWIAWTTVVATAAAAGYLAANVARKER